MGKEKFELKLNFQNMNLLKYIDLKLIPNSIKIQIHTPMKYEPTHFKGIHFMTHPSIRGEKILNATT